MACESAPLGPTKELVQIQTLSLTTCSTPFPPTPFLFFATYNLPASTLHHLQHHITHTITSLNTYNHMHWYLHSKDNLLRLYKRLLCCLYQHHSFPPFNTPYNLYTRALLHLSKSHLVSISVSCLTESVS